MSVIAYERPVESRERPYRSSRSCTDSRRRHVGPHRESIATHEQRASEYGRSTALHAQRGQSLPFWLLAVLLSLSLVFFVYNDANTVRYQIRAQNAADSAATAALSSDAAKLNSVQTLLLALNVQDVKVRSILAGESMLLTGGDTACGSNTGYLTSPACANDLSAGVTDLQHEVTNLQTVVNTVQSFGQLTGNDATAPNATVGSFFKGNCVALSTDCAFKYTTVASGPVNGQMVVDAYACETVPTFARGLLSKSNASYYAIGHSTQTLAIQQPAVLNGGNGFGTLAGDTILGGQMSLFPQVQTSTLVGNFAGLSTNFGYYVPTAVQSTQATQKASSLC